MPNSLTVQTLSAVRDSVGLVSALSPLNSAALEGGLEQDGPLLAKYPPLDLDLPALEDALSGLCFSGPASTLLDRIREHTAAQLRLLALRGTPGFSALSARLYLPPGEAERLEIERALCLKDAPTAGEAVEVAEVAAALRGALEGLGLRDWRVEVAPLLTRCRVSSAERQVMLSSTASYRKGDARKLIAHEIYTHVLRAANGAQQPLSVLAHGLPGYDATEEGLAGALEQLAGVGGRSRAKAQQAYAVFIAQQHGLRDTVRALRDAGASSKKAFSMALRAKRGLTDLEEPGGWGKDAAYFRGELAVGAYLQAGGALPPLWVGKIGLSDLEEIEVLRNLGEVNAPALLPPLPGFD